MLGVVSAAQLAMACALKCLLQVASTAYDANDGFMRFLDCGVKGAS